MKSVTRLLKFALIKPARPTSKGEGRHRTPFSFTNDGGADMTGDFAIYDPIKYGGLGSVANGTLRPTGITVGPQAAVPEPASWALMISGFGLAGGILRRRRGQALLAA
jgi:hypothetical protein